MSAELRSRTAPLHGEIEVLLGLPGAIRDRSDYLAWLSRFLGLYEPLECAMARFPEWEAVGIEPRSRSHATCLAHDLRVLGADPRHTPRAPHRLLPTLPTFGHALGAFYVLEGATLGGRLILRDLEPRIGPQITGATRFFGGRGETVGPMWQVVRSALDAFGRQRPKSRPDVVAGAERTFQALLDWFGPFCTAGGDR